MARFSSSFSVAALVAFGATCVLCWPHDTHADGEAPLMVELGRPGHFQVEGLTLDGQIERDAKAKTGWVVVVKARNDGNVAGTSHVQTEVTRSVGSPIARVQPSPTPVWHTDETVTLAPGQSTVRRYEVPAEVAAQLARIVAASPAPAAAKAKTVQEQQAAMFAPRATFAVKFQRSPA